MICPKTSTRARNQPLVVLKRPKKDSWKCRFSFQGAVTVGYGISGRVLAINKDLVIKDFTQDEQGQRALRCERAVYEELQRDGLGSEYIVNFEEEWQSGLVLERLDTTLRLFLMGSDCPPEPSLARRWSRETADGLAYLHDKSILHGDLGCHNILISNKNHVKLCDFAGSKIGEELGFVFYEVRSQHPLHRGEQPTVKTELFALGSALFEMWTSKPPYHDESNVNIRKSYAKGQFPLEEIDNPNAKRIIRGCWENTYVEVSQVRTELGLDELSHARLSKKVDA